MPTEPRPAGPSRLRETQSHPSWGSKTGRSWTGWVALGAAVVLLGASEAASPVRHAATRVWQALRAPDLELVELNEIETLLSSQNPRLDRATVHRIANAVQGCRRDHGVHPRLTLAVMFVESSARPSVRSPKGAIGLMQVMPHMFEDLGLPGNVAHIESNIEAGCLLLADNIRRLGEDKGISAYFWGQRIGGEGYLGKVKAVRESLESRDPPAVSAGRG